MAGVLGGVMHAPLMAAAFAFGITGDGSAILPLLTTTIISYACTVMLMRRSILTEKIARRGRHVWREMGVDPLERSNVEEWMSTKIQSIPANMRVADALAGPFGSEQIHRAFPVLDGDRLVGVLERQMLQGQAETLSCAQVLQKFAADVAQEAFTLPQESCRTAAARMARLRLERLPVLRDAQSRELVGILSRSDLIGPTLAHFHEEELRERGR